MGQSDLRPGSGALDLSEEDVVGLGRGGRAVGEGQARRVRGSAAELNIHWTGYCQGGGGVQCHHF